MLWKGHRIHVTTSLYRRSLLDIHIYLFAHRPNAVCQQLYSTLARTCLYRMGVDICFLLDGQRRLRSQRLPDLLHALVSPGM